MQNKPQRIDLEECLSSNAIMHELKLFPNLKDFHLPLTKWG